MEQIRSKPAFPRKATGKTWVFQERQKVNQQIAGADKNIDIKTRRPGHRQAQFYISNKLIFNNFLLRLKFSFIHPLGQTQLVAWIARGRKL